MLENMLNYILEKGFEGVIIRHSTATYQFGKRSNKMRKLKSIQLLVV